MKLNISFTHLYSFSAAHRLYSPVFSDEKNLQVYGKCNNLYGHGHDYTVEITIKGEPDKESGMIMPSTELNSAVTNLLSELNYKHLNKETPFFLKHVSTGEMIIQFLWDELNKRIPSRLLYHIKLWESNNNYFEIGEDI